MKYCAILCINFGCYFYFSVLNSENKKGHRGLNVATINGNKIHVLTKIMSVHKV